MPCASPALQALLLPGVIDQDAAHGLSGRGKEVRAILPALLIGSCQAQPRFVHQRGGLERVTRGFTGHLMGCEPAEFAVNDWEKLLSGVGIAFVEGVKDARDFVHACKQGRCTSYTGKRHRATHVSRFLTN